MPAAGQNGVGAVDARAPQAVAGAAEEALVAGAPAREAVAEAAVRALFILRGAADAPGAARAKSAVGEDGNGARAGGRAKGRVDEARHDGDEARHVGVLREERDGDGVCVAARGDAGARARRKRHGHVGERRERIERGLDLRGRRSVGQRRRGPLAEGEAERPRVGEALEELDLVALAARAGVVAARAGPERAVVPRPAGVAVAAEDAVAVPGVRAVGVGAVDQVRGVAVAVRAERELRLRDAGAVALALVRHASRAGEVLARGAVVLVAAGAEPRRRVARAGAGARHELVVAAVNRRRITEPGTACGADAQRAVGARPVLLARAPVRRRVAQALVGALDLAGARAHGRGRVAAVAAGALAAVAVRGEVKVVVRVHAGARRREDVADAAVRAGVGLLGPLDGDVGAVLIVAQRRRAVGADGDRAGEARRVRQERRRRAEA
mmetsp:Transcript_23483/g.79314  ORF Transcript_23483/g.79314 Transcript_23483/m.79314 type:complete len:440 (-) Transcript_23483:755-2074(-)